MKNLDSLNAKRAAIIYNPVARTLARRERLLQTAMQAVLQRGVECRLVPTTAPGSAAEQTKREVEDGCDLIFVAGGDGTINEVANGLLNTRVPLAILPGGTANVLAHELRLPLDLEKAIDQIPALQPLQIAAGIIAAENLAGRCFLCMAGAGLDAEIVYHIDLDMKAIFGKLAYYFGGFAQVFRPLREFEVIVDGKAFEASFALISRVRNYGGDLEIARGASLLRDDFEVVLFRGKQSYQYLPYLFGVALKCADRIKGVSFIRGRSIICNQPPGDGIYVQVDGELAGKLPISAEIVPDALTLLVPPAYLTRERSLIDVPACA